MAADMRIVHIIPGAGGMYCGNCLRDNALVTELKRLGHSALMVPLYLPMTLDEENQATGAPIFFNGISVYLEQKVPLFRAAPRWLHRLIGSGPLLRWAASRAGSTQSSEMGEMTISMLRGEAGHQARELRELIAWLNDQDRPDLVVLSNALLAGMAPEIKARLNVPVVCMLQGEDAFLDSLGPCSDSAWELLRERARHIDLFIAPSHYFAERMSAKLAIPRDKVHVVYNGIHLDGFRRAAESDNPPVIGYFARMCDDKGLPLLIEAFIILKKRDRVPGLRLRAAGGLTPLDERQCLSKVRRRLREEGLSGAVEFHPNVDRARKQELLRSFTVFSVPAHYGEAFGLYVIEALASGVPVVQPAVAAFPELVQITGGGVLFEPSTPGALADALEELLLSPSKARALGDAGRRNVLEKFNARRMASEVEQLYRKVAER